MKICNEKLCCGCGVCKTVCPQNAIRMTADERGFLHPEIAEELCVNCGLCKKRCPVLRGNPKPDPGVFASYAAWNKNTKELKESTSGGIFWLLAKEVLAQNGVVFGAVWTEDWKVRHTFAETPEEAEKFRQSKYMQSETGDAYLQVRDFLRAGRKVLFSGTPCQVAALHGFLGKPDPNLLTTDIICHGVPSPAVFRRYRAHLEELHHAKMTYYRFRNKVPSWADCKNEARFDNGEIHAPDLFEDPYFTVFVQNLSLRESCYSCRFANAEHPADITIADFWGFTHNSFRFFHYQRGCSFVMVNTARGAEAFRKIAPQLVCTPRPVSEAAGVNTNLLHPQPKPENAEIFWSRFADPALNFAEICNGLTSTKNLSGAAYKLLMLKAKYRFLFPVKLIRRLLRR